MKIEIERCTQVNTPVVIDPDKIKYKKLTEDFEGSGIEVSIKLSSKNFEKFLNENNSQMSQIFNVITAYGHAKLGQDSYNDDNMHYYVRALK